MKSYSHSKKYLVNYLEYHLIGKIGEGTFLDILKA